MSPNVAASQCCLRDPASGTIETIEYRECDGCQLYTTLHSPASPIAGALLCGPIGAERERSHRTLVDLARSLAASGCTTLRFDYRGIGESTGRFEECGLSDWRRDIEFCVERLAAELCGRPLVLWGVRAGALLASECFHDGVGDAAMFCAPLSGEPLLQDILRRTLVADMMARPGARRTTREEVIAALMGGEIVNVDGYPWSPRLWMDAAEHQVAIPFESERRPWQLLDFKGAPKLELTPDALARSRSNRDVETTERFWESSPVLVPRQRTFVTRVVQWVQSVAANGGRR